MEGELKPLYVDVDTVIADWGCSRAMAYNIIRELNRQLKEQCPKAIVIAGKVNRHWYDEACLKE